MAMACHDYTNKLSYNFSPSTKAYQSTMTGSGPKPDRSGHLKPTLPVVTKKSYKSRISSNGISVSGRKGKLAEDPDYLAHGTGIPR